MEMSNPVNEQQVSATSPSRSRRSSATPVDSSQRATHATDQNTPGQARPTTRSVSAVTNHATQSRGYPLHEFHSLLEAAQRIANSAPFDTEGHRWREDDQPEPIIHLRRRRAGDLSQRRILLREYSGRPHVPGEDSGSEGEDDENEMDSETNDRREQSDALNPWPNSNPMRGVEDSDTNMPSSHPTDSASGEISRTRPDHGRTRDRQPEDEEERDLLEQALARSRAARSRFETENRRSTLSDSQGARYSTTGSLPTSQSFFDWAPEPPTTTEPSPSIFRSRSRATSIRRWRPAERLQDYASNHARRDSGNAPPTLQPSVNGSNTTWADVGTTAPSTRVTDTNLRSHEDVVDRVERALQQYRIARRALRPQSDDIAFEALPSGEAAQSASSRALRNRTSIGNAPISDSSNVTPITSDTPDPVYDLDSSGWIRLPTTHSGDLSTTAVPSIRPPTAGFQRPREDPLRQRIRDQIRERRRRGAQQILETGTGRETPLARGPLFEGSSNPALAPPSDTRRMIEQVRQANMREQSVEFKRARGALQYLARLRDTDITEVKAWTAAAELGLHNKGLEEDVDTNLAWSIDALPRPTFTSWLEPGTTWTGVQDANETGEKPARSYVSHHDTAGAREQRERLDLASRQHESFRTRMGLARDPLERTFLGDGPSDPIGVARHSMQILEDAERSLNSMLERSEELLRENDRQLQDNDEQLRQNRERLRDTDRRLTLLDEAVRRRAETRSRHVLTSDPPLPVITTDSDWWNVKVTLHSIDERQMTVSGTMTASHKLNRPSHSVTSSMPDTTEQDSSGDTSMDSFFTGDIVDFVNHGLDTLPSSNPYRGTNNSANARHRRQQDEWKVGGPETDLNYWAGIGPFKREIDRAIKVKEKQNDVARTMRVDGEQSEKRSANGNTTSTSNNDTDMTMDNTDKQRSTSDLSESTLSTPLTEEEKYAVKMTTMADLLCNTKWLNENIGAQGWILMRWKERCFVSPGTDPNPDVRRPWISNQPRESNQHSVAASMLGDDWNVSDLLSHDRLRRRRERDTRVWSTNAAEREELATTTSHPSSTSRVGINVTTTTDSGSGSRPSASAWGLTISGFYYVALERKTGRVEALYYDCGSTPFQRLKMSPETLYRVPSGSSSRRRGEHQDGDKDEETTDFSGIVGLKTGFSVVEFR